ncbi:hypothetical protein [Thermus sp.]|uniref:hypothetical protein n=1 Tax=Thermus sp. TaxID=275 RepID=UPI00307F83F2
MEARVLSQRAMGEELAYLQAFFEGLFPGQGKVLAALFASIVHGAYMLERHLGSHQAEALLEEGVRVFVRGLEAPGGGPR